MPSSRSFLGHFISVSSRFAFLSYHRRMLLARPLPLLVALTSSLHGSRIAMCATAGEDMLRQPTWAVIGDVLHPRKPARAVAERLEALGKTVVRVNPRVKPGTDPHGVIFRSLRDAAAKSDIDVVDLIINPRDGLVQMEHAAALGIKSAFVQPGAGSDEILALCEREGIAVHEGCVLRET